MKNKARKHISLILCILICISSFPSLQAVGLCTLSMTSPSVAYSDQEQTATMEVRLSESVTFSATQYVINTPRDLQITKATLGSTDLNLLNNNNATTNSYTITYSGAPVTTDLLATLTFSVPAGKTVGSYDVSMTISAAYHGSNTITALAGLTAETTLNVTEADMEQGTSESYAVSLDAPANATIGESVDFSVTVSGRAFSSAQLEMDYDPSHLVFESISAGAAETDKGTIMVAHFGNENQVPFTYTVSFTALAEGEATVALKSAAFGTAASAESGDLTAASVTGASAGVTIAKRQYQVTLDEIYAGAKTVIEGEDYTFTPADNTHYTYGAVTATMDGEPVAVTSNADGSYIIEDVQGDLVIDGERAANQYAVKFTTYTGVSLPEEDVATYMTDYTFKIPTKNDYEIWVSSIKIGGVDVTCDENDGIITIKGSKIIGEVTIILEQERTNAVVSVTGTASDEVEAPSTAKPGTDYQIVLTPDARYEYEITAEVNGTAVIPSRSGNTYIISGTDIEAGTLKIIVNKTLKTDGLSVQKYLKLNGTAIWLVLNSVDQQIKDVYTYEGNDMFWSAQYQAYCYLVIAADSDEITASKLGLRSGETVEIDYGMDVNKSGKVDANDAQLTYNIYNVQYNDFTESVTMEKILRADLNNDKTVDVADAELIIDRILNR